jgi:undecaprenyl diphosphate synthase
LDLSFMEQSTSLPAPPGVHVAIIMDGNGRWANARGRPRAAGHLAGVKSVREIVRAASSLGVGTLTLYAFSADNWRRPTGEVSTLLRLFRSSLAEEIEQCVANGVRLSIVGRRDRLPGALVRAVEHAESTTAGGGKLWLRIAIDYSSRDAILYAAARHAASGAETPPTREEFAQLLCAVHHSDPAPDVDLLIRTGGEQRLSDFLLWECAYAELYFTPRFWPEFDAGELARAVGEFQHRERRFGGLPLLKKAAGAAG